MGWFDFFGGKKAPLTLDVATIDKWPERLLRHQGVQAVMDEFIHDAEKRKRRIQNALALVTNADAKTRVPERAHGIYDEHSAVFATAAEQLLALNLLNNPYVFTEQQDAFREKLIAYRQATQKSDAALREYFATELHELDEAVRAYEDGFLHVGAKLEEARLPAIAQLKQAIAEYKSTREREEKLRKLRDGLNAEVDSLEARRLKIKEKITFYIERAGASKFKDLLAEEERLLEKSDTLKLTLRDQELSEQLKPVEQRLAFLRKQMINDVTALNISEQRSFLEATKDELRLAKRKLEKVDELLAAQSFESYRRKFDELLQGMDVRVEGASSIADDEDDDVAPQ